MDNTDIILINVVTRTVGRYAPYVRSLQHRVVGSWIFLGSLRILMTTADIGRLGEKMAAKYLKKQGYRIIEKNAKLSYNELDLIALNRNDIVFVEVKARDTRALSPMTPRPAASVTPEKQRKIIKLASKYKVQNYPDKKARFDIVEVYLDTSGKRIRCERVEHLIGAFDFNSAHAHK